MGMAMGMSAKSSAPEQLEVLDYALVRIGAAMRRALVSPRKRAALIVVDGERMDFFHRGEAPLVITGRPAPIDACTNGFCR